MKVAVLHPSVGEDGRWIDDFAPEASGYAFEKIAPPAEAIDWHSRGAVSSRAEWKAHFLHVREAFRADPAVIVTNFPQLALAAATEKALRRSRVRIVGWSYNLGDISSAVKGRLSGLFLRRAERLIVHSTEEIGRYARWHGLPEERFRFVPLQVGALEPREPDRDRPFAIAMGSAGRDYRTLMAAARGFEGRLVVIAKPSLLEGLEIPPNVEVRSGLTLEECRDLNARALFSVTPIANLDTASGQVTFIASMALGCPVIATTCPGSRDYLTAGRDALMVEPFEEDALRIAMNRLWSDEAERRRLGRAAYETWQRCYSDPKAGENLVRILDEVTDR